MNTFKWSIPEPRPSEIEKITYLFGSIDSPDKPTESEIRNFVRWEKKLKNGIEKYILRNIIWLLCILAALVLLHRFNGVDLDKGRLIFPAAWIIAAISMQYRDWRQYLGNKDKIAELLETLKTQNKASIGVSK